MKLKPGKTTLDYLIVGHITRDVVTMDSVWVEQLYKVRTRP